MKFNSRSDLLNFLDANRDCVGNPFSSDEQAISLCPEGATEEENLSIYFDLAKQVGRTYGKYIKEMEVKLWRMGDPFEVRAFLLALLSKLPNLRILHLNLALGAAKWDTPFSKTFDLNARIHTASKLEYLNCRIYDSTIIFVLLPVFATYGPTLKKISVTPFTWSLLSTDKQKAFKDLQEFNLCWYTNQVSVVETNAMYAPFPEDFAPNLKKLRLLYIDCGELERPVEWLFYMLRKFPQLTLLNLTGFYLMPNDPVRMKDFPGNATLKSLKFQDHADINYDFLARLTSLQYLFIEGARFTFSYENEEDTYEAEEGEIKLRCFLYRKQLARSNVWKKVPSLKKIVFQRYAKSGKVPPEAEVYVKPQ